MTIDLKTKKSNIEIFDQVNLSLINEEDLRLNTGGDYEERMLYNQKERVLKDFPR